MANQHVTPHSESGWQVKRAGADRATKLFETQLEAINYAHTIAKNQNSELFVHDKHGRIRERNSYGNDPYPPQG